MKNLLTPLELKVMNILWTLKSAYIKDIRAHWDEDPVPAYNTISTIVRILKDKKQYIGHREHGRTHEYFPLIEKADFQRHFLQNAISQVFAGSKTALLSTLVDGEQVSDTELNALRALIDSAQDDE